MPGLIEGMGIVGNMIQGPLNFASQMITNKQNLDLQREEWGREDNAMQRKVKDLTAAGLNPVLAAQGSGSPTSLAVKMSAPEYSAGSLSDVFAAGIGRAQQRQADADADTSVANSKANEWLSRAAQAKGKFDEAMWKGLMPYARYDENGAGLVNYELDRRVAESKAAVEGAKEAAARASATQRDFELTSLLGVLSNLGSQAGNINLGLLGAKLIESLSGRR